MAFADTNESDSDNDNHNTYSPLAVRPYDYQFLCNPAFTEAVFVKSASDAFSATVRRLEAGIVEGAMDLDVSKPLERSASHHSTASVRSQRSQRSQTVRNKPRKYASYMSSSASSIASSDKSLTSFPSFSPESPRDERVFSLPTTDGIAHPPSLSAPSIKSLTTSPLLPQDRSALFDDDPLSVPNVPGALHHANDEHIERLIARKGAVALVRQYAQDLAYRDAQIAALRRKAENRERALRKIVLECGLSNLDLETRLRVIETGTKPADDSSKDDLARESGLEDLMNDAMTDSPMGSLDCVDHDQTIRVKDILKAVEPAEPAKEVQRGWKDYIWGSTSRKTSRASSVNGDAISAASGSGRGSISRPSVLQNGIFQSPQETIRSPSRASSMLSENIARDRKPSSGLALWATKLVAGNANSTREFESGNRGRSNSTGETAAHRTHSTASAKTTMSARTVPVNSGGKVIPPSRRTTVAANSGTVRGPPQDRWDTMGTSPPSTSAVGLDNYGPVEMDTILEPDAQPPTMTQIYNNAYNPEFLTDRFGFIYDQRRKKRAKEAAEQVRKNKRGSRVEMLSHARGSSVVLDEGTSGEDSRPNTPLSTDERSEDGKPGKRWQDYLKTATFTTELLSHTPAGSVPAFEIMEGGEVPRSPGIIPEERGFLPSSASAIAAPSVPVTSENATISKPDMTPPPTAALTKEDAEPVKLLLEQLQEVHDSLQKDKTVKWNDFLRKVRAERKREGEAAAAAFAAETRTQRPMAVMPEVSLADGEMIGIAGLGNKGKVGRAKWNEFKNLVLGGIPVAYRAKIWAECSGAIALRIPGYYDDLVGRKEEDDDPIIISQIRLDINRTLTDNIFFRKGQGVNKLTEVLVAYSRRNPEVGYCQGMNLITAYLLLIMQTAEDAFWVLTSIIENILPRGYYDHSLSASKADQQVLRQYVTSILPKLSSHLDDLSVDLDTLTFQWFLSVFTDCLSAEALFRVWDVVLCVNDGSTFLFQVALALLKLNEQQLLQCSSPAAVYTYLNHQMTNHAISIDGLIHASEGLRKVVRRDEVENRRAKAIEAERDLVRQRELKNAERKAKRIAAAAAANGNQTPPEVIVSKPSTPNAEEGDAFEELTVRTPVPVEEERELGAEG